MAFGSEARHRLQPLLLQAQGEGRRLLDLPHLLEPGRFGENNRAGIESTLHRISAIRNRTGDVVGLTCRVGRAVFGTVTMVRDLLNASHLSTDIENCTTSSGRLSDPLGGSVQSLSAAPKIRRKSLKAHWPPSCPACRCRGFNQGQKKAGLKWPAQTY